MYGHRRVLPRTFRAPYRVPRARGDLSWCRCCSSALAVLRLCKKVGVMRKCDDAGQRAINNDCSVEYALCFEFERLAESLIKRDLGVKDMSKLLPGHGGMMDRLDSMLPASLMTYLVMVVFFG